MTSLKYIIIERALIKSKTKNKFMLQGEDFKQNILENFRKSEESEPPKKISNRLNVKIETLCNKKLYIASSKNKNEGKSILYLHGGGFVLESTKYHWIFAKYLVKNTGAKIFFPQYPIAPENSCIDALAMIINTYKLILQETDAKNIVLMGDSAGGGIALSTAMHLRNLGLPQPGNIILISPAVLMECPKTQTDIEYMTVLEQRDKMISSYCFDTICDLWRKNLDRTDYRVNPIYGDLKGLGKITVFTGTGEVLNLAARKMKDEAKEQNVEIDYYEKEYMMHCWVLVLSKESRRERKIIRDIIGKSSNF